MLCCLLLIKNSLFTLFLLFLCDCRYADCPHQACALLPLASLTEGLREASDLWRQGNSKEVECFVVCCSAMQSNESTLNKNV